MLVRKTLKIVSLAVVALCFLQSHVPVVSAEFISINPLCRHITNPTAGSAGVVVIPNSASGVAGLLMYSSKASIPAQGFNLKSLTALDSESVFLKYSKEAKRFTELTVAGGSTFKLNGNLSLTLHNIHINVSYEGTKEPYTSVVFTPDESVIAFTGLQTVMNGKGPSLVTWLGANSVSDSEVVSVNFSGELLLGGKAYTGQSLGLPTQDSNQNICMNSGVMYVSTASLERLEKKSTKNELTQADRTKLLEKSRDFFDRNATLVVLKAGLVVQDGYGQLLSVQPSAGVKLFDDQIVCRVEALS